MSKIGYTRVSSKEQNLDRQLEALQSVSKVFSDKASGQSTERPQLQAMLDYLRKGDIVIVTELDRLGRNNKVHEIGLKTMKAYLDKKPLTLCLVIYLHSTQLFNQKELGLNTLSIGAVQMLTKHMLQKTKLLIMTSFQSWTIQYQKTWENICQV